MSEYQYYEFQAIDQPLTEVQMRELRLISSRADITATSFINCYTFGDFKGNPDRLMEKHFDAFLYLANWGTRKFSLRLPLPSFRLECARPYCPGNSVLAREKGGFVILDFSSQDEDGDWEEKGEGWLSSLVPLRAELAGGDHRVLYLAWLLCVQCGEVDDGAPEPPCPPGLGKLSGPLTALVKFLRINPDLVEMAAAASAPPVELSLGKEFERWVAALPDSEKTALLVQAVNEGAAHVRGVLLSRYRAAVASAQPSDELPPPRTAAELRSLAEKHREERRRREAEREARERIQREREAAAARQDYLDLLAGRQPETWSKVDTLIATKRPTDYEQAVQLLKDLYDLAVRSGSPDEAKARIRQLCAQHANKPSFLRRLDKSGVPRE